MNTLYLLVLHAALRIKLVITLVTLVVLITIKVVTKASLMLTLNLLTYIIIYITRATLNTCTTLFQYSPLILLGVAGVNLCL